MSGIYKQVEGILLEKNIDRRIAALRKFFDEHPTISQENDFRNPKEPSHPPRNLLFQAINLQDERMVRYLVEEKGFDVNFPSPLDSKTPLIHAAQHPGTDIAKFLLSKGARPLDTYIEEQYNALTCLISTPGIHDYAKIQMIRLLVHHNPRLLALPVANPFSAAFAFKAFPCLVVLRQLARHYGIADPSLPKGLPPALASATKLNDIFVQIKGIFSHDNSYDDVPNYMTVDDVPDYMTVTIAAITTALWSNEDINYIFPGSETFLDRIETLKKNIADSTVKITVILHAQLEYIITTIQEAYEAKYAHELTSEATSGVLAGAGAAAATPFSSGMASSDEAVEPKELTP